jgi:hypothetical protein
LQDLDDVHCDNSFRIYSTVVWSLWQGGEECDDIIVVIAVPPGTHADMALPILNIVTYDRNKGESDAVQSTMEVVGFFCVCKVLRACAREITNSTYSTFLLTLFSNTTRALRHCCSSASHMHVALQGEVISPISSHSLKFRL